MNTEIIFKTARATLEGTISFPEAVGQLIGAGVEYYYVDYVAMRKMFYSENGDNRDDTDQLRQPAAGCR